VQLASLLHAQEVVQTSNMGLAYEDLRDSLPVATVNHFFPDIRMLTDINGPDSYTSAPKKLQGTYTVRAGWPDIHGYRASLLLNRGFL